MGMPLKDLYTLPAFLPVPKSNCHVIGGCENERLGGVDCNRSDIVWMSFKGGYLFGGIIVVNAKLEVIRTADDPVLARNETTGSDRDIGDFESFDY